MKEFVAGRHDVLVSTVIIENGIDISNVNTIVVTRADMLGLSQLYQLRGRVGRSSEQAYACFLTPPFREAQELALRRLHALEQYTDLGSGFQIAMRDLEIRGAGNILGVHQHGFVAAVGFEMYCRLLEEAVKEIRGEKPSADQPSVSVDIPLEAFIPKEFVSDSAARVAVYQKLSAAKTLSDVEEAEAEMSDRFGPMPQAVPCAAPFNKNQGRRARRRVLKGRSERRRGIDADGGRRRRNGPRIGQTYTFKIEIKF